MDTIKDYGSWEAVSVSTYILPFHTYVSKPTQTRLKIAVSDEVGAT